MLAPVESVDLLVAFLVTIVGAWVQGSLGLGFAIVTVPLLGLLDHRLVPVPQMLVVVPLTVGMAWRERHALEWKSMGWVLAGRIPGAVLGIALVKLASQSVLDIGIGVSVLGAALILATRGQPRRTPLLEFSAGTASGVSGMVSAIGGPPVALLYRKEQGATVRANLAGIFTIGVIITLFTRASAGEIAARDLEVAAALLPALLIGLALSHRTRGWVEGPWLRSGVLTLSVIAGSGLILRGWSGLLDR